VAKGQHRLAKTHLEQPYAGSVTDNRGRGYE